VVIFSSDGFGCGSPLIWVLHERERCDDRGVATIAVQGFSLGGREGEELSR
jgi:hypothetical protein